MVSFSVIVAALAANGALAAISQRQSDSSGPIKYVPKTPPLDTPWTSQVGTNPWPQYPRPKMQRASWQTLNGIWTYSNASSLDAVQSPPFNQTLANEVLVPSCLESGLSGIQTSWNLYSWFSTHFTVPSNWTGDRVLLNFGAVDYEATVFVNGKNATFNRGGYFSFSVDVTDFLVGGVNELLVFVHDPTDSGSFENVIPIGKQTLKPSHIFYTPCSGIWQSVWIESAPAEYVSQLAINGGADGQLNVTVSTSGNSSSTFDVTVYERGTKNSVATRTGSSGSQVQLAVTSPKLWSPDTPNLYDVVIKLGDDEISSYTGFRTIAKGAVNGVERVILNGNPIFAFGTLDQGYWPDGIYTPPTYEAMVFDIQTLKDVGMNMLRKHIKVEPALFYTAADEMGILVIQDMPALRPSQTETLDNCTIQTVLPSDAQQAEFQRQLGVLVTQLSSYTCIYTWVIYNEGWGQITTSYPEFGLTDMVKQLDPTRLVDATTGWFDHGAGDYSDNHHYANPQCGVPWNSINSSPFDPSRIGFQGEFGGTGNNVSIEHLWNNEAAINTINQTYELDDTIEIWNYRGHFLLAELLSHVELFSCSGAVWTQTTDVEGEVNGLLTYDRRILRPDVAQWKADAQALYDALAKRSNSTTPTFISTPINTVMATPLPQGYYRTKSWTPAGPPETVHWQPGQRGRA